MNATTAIEPVQQVVPKPFVTPAGRVVRCTIFGQPILFTITNRKDGIQKVHLRGKFYEDAELEIIRKWFRPGSVFCDIGANIGNHTIFAMKFLHPSNAILFEPNPVAIEILRSNLELNGLTDRVDLSCLGFGLSDADASGLRIEVDPRNLGGGRMLEGDGTLEVRRGDDLLAGRHVDFIKIDVETMELRVLGGLKETIARCRPLIFVEVDRVNLTEFKEWVKANNYVAPERYRRYRANENFLLAPAPV